MALAFTSKVDGVIGNKRVVEVVATFDSSYPTGGEQFSASALGLHQVDSVVVPSHKLNGVAVSNAQAQTGVSLQVDLTSKSTPKLKVYTGATTEASNGSDQSGVAVILWVFGS